MNIKCIQITKFYVITKFFLIQKCLTHIGSKWSNLQVLWVPAQWSCCCWSWYCTCCKLHNITQKITVSETVLNALKCLLESFIGSVFHWLKTQVLMAACNTADAGWSFSPSPSSSSICYYDSGLGRPFISSGFWANYCWEYFLSFLKIPIWKRYFSTLLQSNTFDYFCLNFQYFLFGQRFGNLNWEAGGSSCQSNFKLFFWQID